MTKQSGPLRKADFVAWLGLLPEYAIVGRRGDACGCPLARYLAEVLGYTEVVVSVAEKLAWRHNGVRVRRQAAAWMRAFIIAVDAGYSEYITAGECLRLLAVKEDQ